MDRRVYDRYVIQIAEQGSLTKAAAALGISQPALSSGLTTLEKELGYKLFNRKSVPITFTPEGELYFEYMKRMQVLSEDLQRRIDNLREETNGKVAIGGPVAYIESIVTDAIVKFRKRNPNYRVAIKCSPLAELIEMAEAGEIDCFISTRETLPERFEKQLIKQEKIYLCIPRSNPINEMLIEYRTVPGNGGLCFDYSLLDGQEFIYLEEGQPLQMQMEEFFKANCIRPSNKVVVNQVSTAVHLAIKGDGICFASEEALEENIDLSSVFIYNLPSSISGRNIYIAYDRELFMSNACKELINCLVNQNDQ